MNQNPEYLIPASSQSLASLEGLTISVPPEQRIIIQNAFLHLHPGECHILRGPTGSGKSLLLNSLAGQIPSEWIEGNIEINDQHPAVILQNPETQMLSPTIAGECAFGLENLGWKVERMREMVRRSLSAVGLDIPWNTPTRTLSMGQKYRLLIAAFLCRQSRLFLLDEPGTQLDSHGRKQLADCLLERKAAGCAILLCEQNPAELAFLADYTWCLDQERIIPDRSSTPSALPPPVHNRTQGHQVTSVIEVKNIDVQGAPGNLLLQDVSFTVKQGQFLLITGPNGSGKSSLIHCLAGFQKSSHGQIIILGAPPKPSRLQGILGLVLQNPERQFFEISVQQELCFGLQRLGYDRDMQEELCTLHLERFGLSALRTLPPWRLSYGQKRLLALASALILHPRILLVDDPCAGLDSDKSSLIHSILEEEMRDREMAVVWAAHELPFAHSPDNHLHIQGGRLEPAL